MATLHGMRFATNHIRVPSLPCFCFIFSPPLCPVTSLRGIIRIICYLNFFFILFSILVLLLPRLYFFHKYTYVLSAERDAPTRENDNNDAHNNNKRRLVCHIRRDTACTN